MKWFFRDGNLTSIGGTVIALIGVIAVLGSIAWAKTKFAFIAGIFFGVFLIAIASASLKALVLGIKPFTNDPIGWRKAKKSYKNSEAAPNAFSEKDK